MRPRPRWELSTLTRQVDDDAAERAAERAAPPVRRAVGLWTGDLAGPVVVRSRTIQEALLSAGRKNQAPSLVSCTLVTA